MSTHLIFTPQSAKDNAEKKIVSDSVNNINYILGEHFLGKPLQVGRYLPKEPYLQEMVLSVFRNVGWEINTDGEKLIFSAKA